MVIRTRPKETRTETETNKEGVRLEKAKAKGWSTKLKRWFREVRE